MDDRMDHEPASGTTEDPGLPLHPEIAGESDQPREEILSSDLIEGALESEEEEDAEVVEMEWDDLFKRYPRAKRYAEGYATFGVVEHMLKWWGYGLDESIKTLKLIEERLSDRSEIGNEYAALCTTIRALESYAEDLADISRVAEHVDETRPEKARQSN